MGPTIVWGISPVEFVTFKILVFFFLMTSYFGDKLLFISSFVLVFSSIRSKAAISNCLEEFCLS